MGYMVFRSNVTDNLSHADRSWVRRVGDVVERPEQGAKVRE